MELKNVRRGRIEEYANKFKGASYHPLDPTADHNPLWDVHCRVRLPERDAERDQRQGRAPTCCRTACSSWPRARTCRPTLDGVDQFVDAGILYGPGKAANAGGVADLGPGDGQNSMRYSLDAGRGRQPPARHHEDASTSACVETAERFGTPGNYVNGANIAGFLKVADAMIDQGLV